MKLSKIWFLLMLSLGLGKSTFSQEYDEEKTKKQIEKFQQNPKLYYDKIKALSEKLEQANKNTLNVSDEYLKLMDQKDSVILLYKNQLAKAKRSGTANPQAAVPATTAVASAPPVVAPPAASPVTSKETAKPASATPYRVQLAAFTRDEFAEFFANSMKYLGIERLDNRNVVEISGFANPQEAQTFAQSIRKIGFPSAFVTKYDAGKRIEGYSPAAEGLALKSSNYNPKLSLAKKKEEPKPLDYPDYIPYGYKELVGVKSKVPAEPKINEKPTAVVAAATTKATAPVQPAPKKAAMSEKPQNIAAATPVKKVTPPVNPEKPVYNAPKTAPVAKSSPLDDPLDAAFDKLFKK